MPTYEWRCPYCAETYTEKMTVDQYTIINDELGPLKCRHCGIRCKRVFSATPAHFKGGGWAGKGN
jgi:predicted nucleic acid-binding Zn ribbon protein